PRRYVRSRSALTGICCPRRHKAQSGGHRRHIRRFYPDSSDGSGFETIAVARCLAEHGVFANPYSSYPTGPTAHVAPRYPAFLSFLLFFFVFSVGFALAPPFFSAVVHGRHAALLPKVWELFSHARRPGIWAAVLSLFLPLYFFFPPFEVIYF